MSDYERIRKNAVVLTKDDERNQQKIINEQKELKQAEAKVIENINSRQEKKE